MGNVVFLARQGRSVVRAMEGFRLPPQVAARYCFDATQNPREGNAEYFAEVVTPELWRIAPWCAVIAGANPAAVGGHHTGYTMSGFVLGGRVIGLDSAGYAPAMLVTAYHEALHANWPWLDESDRELLLRTVARGGTLRLRSSYAPEDLPEEHVAFAFESYAMARHLGLSDPVRPRHERDARDVFADIYSGRAADRVSRMKAAEGDSSGTHELTGERLPPRYRPAHVRLANAVSTFIKGLSRLSTEVSASWAT